MVSLQCLFCDHSNPGESKFCNECGTPLHFKPCPQCEGINGRFATTCYRCGGEFAIGQEPAAAPPEPVEAGAERSSEVAFAAIRALAQGLLRSDAPSAASSSAAPADASVAAIAAPAAQAFPRSGPAVPRAVVAALLLVAAIAVPAYQAYRDSEPEVTQSISTTTESVAVEIATTRAGPSTVEGEPAAGGFDTVTAQPDGASLAVQIEPMNLSPSDATPDAPDALASASSEPLSGDVEDGIDQPGSSPVSTEPPRLAADIEAVSAGPDGEGALAHAVEVADDGRAAAGEPHAIPATIDEAKDASPSAMAAPKPAVRLASDESASRRSRGQGASTRSRGRAPVRGKTGDGNQRPATTASPSETYSAGPPGAADVVQPRRESLQMPAGRLQQAVLTRVAPVPNKPSKPARADSAARTAAPAGTAVCQEVIATLTDCDLKTLPKGN